MDVTPHLPEPADEDRPLEDRPLEAFDGEAPDPWAFLIGVAVGAGVAALLLLAT